MRRRRGLMTGRRCKYRGKRKRISATVTDHGFDALQRLARDAGLSQSDLIEQLVRRAAGMEA